MEENRKVKETTDRTIHFPKPLYRQVKLENIRQEELGAKENSEETIINLVRDGLRFRRQIEENTN
jgi:hypothetical protein